MNGDLVKGMNRGDRKGIEGRLCLGTVYATWEIDAPGFEVLLTD